MMAAKKSSCKTGYSDSLVLQHLQMLRLIQIIYLILKTWQQFLFSMHHHHVLDRLFGLTNRSFHTTWKLLFSLCFEKVTFFDYKILQPAHPVISLHPPKKVAKLLIRTILTEIWWDILQALQNGLGDGSVHLWCWLSLYPSKEKEDASIFSIKRFGLSFTFLTISAHMHVHHFATFLQVLIRICPFVPFKA